MGPLPLWLLLALTGLNFPMAASVPELDPIDLVVIPHWHAMYFPAVVNAMKKALLEIYPTVFELGAGKSRLAMIHNGPTGEEYKHEWKTIPLCDTEATCKASIDPIKDYNPNHHDDKSLRNAFGKALEIFSAVHQGDDTEKENIRGNHRVILVLTYPQNGILDFGDEDKKAFDLMHASGYNTYAVYQKKDGEPDQESALSIVTGQLENIKTVKDIPSDFNKATFEWLKNKLIAVSFCQYEERCFFQDAEQNVCKKAHFTPNMTVEDGDCATTFDAPSPAPSNEDCEDLNKCKDTCDDLWSIDDAKSKCESDENCGKTFASETPKRWIQLQHCNGGWQCPACPTTASTTTIRATTTAKTTEEPKKPETTGGTRGEVALALIIMGVVIAVMSRGFENE